MDVMEDQYGDEDLFGLAAIKVSTAVILKLVGLIFMFACVEGAP